MSVMATIATTSASYHIQNIQAVRQLAHQAGFMFNVSVSPKLIDRVFIADGKMSIEECLSVFLRTCAEQVKISITDSKDWGRVRLFYPMFNIDGSFTPEEVVIKTIDGNVMIILASEEAHIIQ